MSTTTALPSSSIAPDIALRRLRVMRISPELFLELFSSGDHPGYKVIDHAVPSGTRVINVRLGWPAWIEVLIEHESFEELKVGDVIPLLAPLMTAP
jgi:hypothetical protein